MICPREVRRAKSEMGPLCSSAINWSAVSRSSTREVSGCDFVDSSSRRLKRAEWEWKNKCVSAYKVISLDSVCIVFDNILLLLYSL